VPLIWEWQHAKSESNPLTLRGHRFAIYDATFSFDGNYAATGSDDKTASVWEWKQPDGRLKPKATLNLLTSSVRGVAFSPDGNLLATASDDGVARLWLWRESEKPGETIELRGGNKGIMFCIAFSRDGQFLVTGSEDGTRESVAHAKDRSENARRSIRRRSAEVGRNQGHAPIDTGREKRLPGRIGRRRSGALTLRLAPSDSLRCRSCNEHSFHSPGQSSRRTFATSNRRSLCSH